MTDPFSVSAGVVGVVSLGLTLSQGFLRYYTPWRDYDDEIQGFTTRVDGLLRTLRALDTFLSPESELQLPDQCKDLVLTSLASCEEACHQLEKILAECKSSNAVTPGAAPGVPSRKNEWLRLKRVAYPFKKETLVTLSKLVSGLCDNLSLALQLLAGALIGLQQKQIQSVDQRTMKILTVVEQHASPVVPSQALVQTRPPPSDSRSIACRNMPDPSMLRDLCDQQQLIDIWLRRKQRLPRSQLEHISQYCSCRVKPRFLQKTSFSAFSLHEKSCPLHADGQQVFGVAGSYTFCTRLLGLSVQAVMMLTRGAGGLAISPMIRVQAVVSPHSPAFSFLRHAAWSDCRSAPELNSLVERVQTTLLRMFDDGRAAPTDRLQDGMTIFHGLFSLYFVAALGRSFARNSETGSYVTTLIGALIDAGVPFNERTVSGSTTSDALLVVLWCLNPKVQNEPSALDAVLCVLEMLLTSGGYVNSLVAEHVPVWRGSAAKAAARSLLRKDPHGFELLEIEIAILLRSAESLKRCLMTQGHQHFNSLVTGFWKLLHLSLGWPEGLTILLQSPLRPLSDPYGISDCFVQACEERQAECASILLRYITLVEPTHLRAAAWAKDLSVIDKVIEALASSRHELQQLALQGLPHTVLCSLSLPTSALLDTNAFDVYEKLESYGIEVQPPFYSRSRDSVYTFAELDIAIFDRLYAAGFSDFNQSGGDNVSVFLNLPWNGYGYNNPADPFRLIIGADWLVSRGAGLCELSQHGYPARFYLAWQFSTTIAQWCSSQQLGSLLEKQPLCANKSLLRLMTDGTQDDCLCACSGHSCTSFQQILRGSHIFRKYKYYDYRFATALAPMMDKLQALAPELLSKVQRSHIAEQYFRYITFEALNLTHTCHKYSRGEYLACGKIVFQRIDAEEIHEIREEEVTLIDQLDQLVAEFHQDYQDYEELGLGLHDFIQEHWIPRMDEVFAENEEEEVDSEDEQRIRELGVILT
ncbi:hypothetical protein BJX70DRAFT_399691 [Aspergillus crustosus]